MGWCYSLTGAIHKGPLKLPSELEESLKGAQRNAYFKQSSAFSNLLHCIWSEKLVL